MNSRRTLVADTFATRPGNVRAIGVFGAGLCLASLALAGCSGSSTSAAATSSSASRPAVSANPSTNPSSSVRTGSATTGAALTACQEWRNIDVEDVPAAVSGTLRATAARRAAAAGVQSPGLAAAMQEVSQLPNTDLTQGQLAAAARDRATIKSDCEMLGVTITS